MFIKPARMPRPGKIVHRGKRLSSYCRDEQDKLKRLVQRKVIIGNSSDSPQTRKKVRKRLNDQGCWSSSLDRHAYKFLTSYALQIVWQMSFDTVSL